MKSFGLLIMVLVLLCYSPLLVPTAHAQPTPTPTPTPEAAMAAAAGRGSLPSLPSIPVVNLPEPSKRFALIIGIEPAEKRAGALVDTLYSQLGFPADQIILLTSNQTEAKAPSRERILGSLGELTKKVPHDGFLVVACLCPLEETPNQDFFLLSNTPVADAPRSSIDVQLVVDLMNEASVSEVLTLQSDISTNFESVMIFEPFIGRQYWRLKGLGIEDILTLWSSKDDFLYKLALLYNKMDRYLEAIEISERSLEEKQAVRNGKGEGDTLYLMSWAYYGLSRYDQVIETSQKALNVFHESRNRKGEAIALNLLGLAYYELSRFDEAVKYFEQSLAIKIELTDAIGKALELNNLGATYRSIGSYDKATRYLDQALTISREEKAQAIEGLALDSLGEVYLSRGQFSAALKHFNAALKIHRLTAHNLEEGLTLINLGKTSFKRKRSADSIRFLGQALMVNRGIGNRHAEGVTLSNLMLAWSSHDLDASIFYGKKAVNVFQELRATIQKLDKKSQRSFLASKEQTYRRLIEMLILKGRIPEAEQVLGMLKEEEYFDFIRRDGEEGLLLNGRLALTPREAEWEAKRQYREIADQITLLGRERGDLLAKSSRSPDEEQRLSKLEVALGYAERAFQWYLDQLLNQSGKSKLAKERVFHLRESQGLMEDLRELGSGAVALYTLVGGGKYRIILVTPDVQKAFEYPIKDSELNRKVAAFREVLQDPKLDPQPLAQELYKILIAPVAKDLEQARAQTLMWSLDGVLRYVPIAALHDGKQYMVERYRNVIFTPASNSRLKDQPSNNWKGLGLGVSKAQAGASALPNVPDELRSIIRDETPGSTSTGGVLPGTVLLDEAFTAVAMKAALHRRYPLVHIASHFAFRPGNETNSALLLGDGSLMTLAEIKTSSNLFSGVELLTLSACDTATGGADADGKEVEGFGVLAQRQGAKAVVASLWPVADEATRLLMQNFYTRRNATAGMLKSEALRQAQLDLLNGKETAGKSSPERQLVREQKSKAGAYKPESLFKFDPRAPYAHPYYWAPFILIGNWK